MLGCCCWVLSILARVCRLEVGSLLTGASVVVLLLGGGTAADKFWVPRELVAVIVP